MFCGLLGRSWELLGASLGALGGVLGGSWGLLGRLEGLQNDIQNEDFLPDLSMQFPPALMGPILEVKIDQNRIKNESNFKRIFKRPKMALQDRLGGLLGRSRAILEAILGSEKAFSYWKT